MSKNILILIGIAVFLKIIYYSYTFLLPFPDHNRLQFDSYGQYFYLTFSNNDSGWYQNIVENGYPSKLEQSNVVAQTPFAFFSLYPYSVKLVKFISNVNTLQAFFIFTSIISVILFLVFYKFVGAIYNNYSLSFVSTLCLMLFPHHYYFSMYYTESLFLLLLVLSFFYLYKANLWLFALFSSLLVLTRINGIVMLIPLLLYSFEVTSFNSIKFQKRLAFFIPAAFAFSAYCVFLYFRTNDFIAFKTAGEMGWGSDYSFPLTVLIRTILDDTSQWYMKYNSIYALMFTIISIYFLFKKQYSFFVLAILGIMFPLIEGSPVAQPRFISVLFPFSILFGTLIFRIQFRFGLIIILFLLQLITLRYWAVTHPFSY